MLGVTSFIVKISNKVILYSRFDDKDGFIRQPVKAKGCLLGLDFSSGSEFNVQSIALNRIVW